MMTHLPIRLHQVASPQTEQTIAISFQQPGSGYIDSEITIDNCYSSVMDQLRQPKFHVIELLEPPYADYDKYICVPSSWIRLRETDDGVVLVKFPTEKLSKTKKRVKKEENFSNDWSIFMAEVKYSTDSYKDAKEYIKILDKILIQGQRRSKGIRENRAPTPDSEILDLLTESNTNGNCEALGLPNNDPKQMNNQATSQLLKISTSELGERQEITKIVDLADSTDKTERYLTRQSLRQSAPTNNYKLLNQIKKLTLEETNKSVQKSDNVENHKEKTPLIKTPPELTNESGVLSALQSLLGDNYKEILEHLHSEFENNLKILNNLEHIFLKNCVLLKNLIDIVDQVHDGDQNDHNVAIKKLKKHMTEEVNTKTNNEKRTGSEVKNCDKNVPGGDENKGNKNSNSMNKIHGQAREFILPPEYDPNDSQWSLKHRKKTKDLVELIPQSGVYVNAIKLKHCLRMSKDSKTLARMLLVEVFSESALSVCSLTGKKANVFDLEGTSIRPGLDEHARTVLLNYVEQYAFENNWVKLDIHTISNSLRNKMQEMRAKKDKKLRDV
ncbi:unnamed protein product [Diatraea saccharalis]|uniref:BEN domain-containing protein n=1 Tax=Diatraea saccharalis TaxID=40085 RepID=A0A9N9QZS7_9NEOP|nr:unnamed protein product [Diatraea saccharalis]